MPALSKKARDVSKTVLYRCGVLPLYHRIRNRNNVTVVMFHRVLPEDDPRWQSSDRNWTTTVELFEQCIDFFKRHYNLIGLEDLLRAKEVGGKLPPRPLLVTFDDGWADNAEHALPVLEKHNVPATLFVVAGAVDAPRLWDQALRSAWMRGELSATQWTAVWSRVGQSPAGAENMNGADFRRLLASLSGLQHQDREELVATVAGTRNGTTTDMLRRDQLLMLHSRGISIACHGLTHAMVPYTSNPAVELTESRLALKQMLNGNGEGAPGLDVFSFPHGACDDATVHLAKRAGYRMLFGSEPVLNRTRSIGREAALGRIHIHPADLSDGAGRLRPELIALWLFTREQR